MQSVMKNKMNFILTPSLEHRALAKIAIILWNQVDVKDFINECFQYLKDVWQKIAKLVVQKSKKLAMPEILEKRLLDLIVPVGLQIRAWVELHHNQYHLVTVLPALFIWTSLGTIDVKRTAEILMKDEGLGAHERFKLACMYCLEDDIRNLWETFSLHRSGYTKHSRSNPQLVSFWAHYLEDTLDQYMYPELYTPYQWAFITAAQSENASSTQYFIQKLNPEDKGDIIQKTAENLAYRVEVAPSEYKIEIFFIHERSDILFLLLSSVDAEQQAEIFKMRTYGVLKCLLAWPWQSLFLETAHINWDFLSKQNYGFLLHHIVDSINYNLNYPSKLLGEFWQQSPEAYKQYFIEGDTDRLIYSRFSRYRKEINLQQGFRRLLLKLCRKKDEKNVMLILKDLSISAKRRFIFVKEGRDTCRHLVSRKRFDSAKYLIQECISSRKEMINFRDLIKNRKNRFSSEMASPDQCLCDLCNPYVWDKYLKLIEDCIIGYKKIKHMQNNTSSKTNFCEDIKE